MKVATISPVEVLVVRCSTSIDVGAAELKSASAELNSASAGALAEAGIPFVAADWTLMMQLNGAHNQQLFFATHK